MTTKKPRAPRAPKKPENESKAQAFVRLGKQRVGKCLKMLENIGKLAGPNYERSEAQVEKIVGALQDALDAVKARFEGKQEVRTEFDL